MTEPRAARTIVLVLAAAALVLTRVPHHQGWWAAVAGVLGLAVLGLGLTWLHGARRPWMRALALTGGAIMLLLPTSHEAVLSVVPAALVALLALSAAYHLRDTQHAQAPRLEPQQAQKRRAWTRLLPLLLVLIAVAAAASVRLVLPDRIGSLYELRAATEPVLNLLVVAAVLLAAVWMRDGLAREARRTEEVQT